MWGHGWCGWCVLKRRGWQIDFVDERKRGKGGRGIRGCGSRRRREVRRGKTDDPRWLLPVLLASVVWRLCRLGCGNIAFRLWRCCWLGCLGFAFRLLSLSRELDGTRRKGATTCGTEIRGGGWFRTEGAKRRKRARLRCRFGGSGSGSRRGRSTLVVASIPARSHYAFEVRIVGRGAGVHGALPEGGVCRAAPGYRCRTKGSPDDGRNGG